MKKIFCAVLALAAMASCSKEYIVAENKQAIGFGEVFVENSTRATDLTYTDTNKVTEFKVWGTVQGEYDANAPIVYIFNGDEVKNSNGTTTVDYDGVWFCNNIQYWVPNADYAFKAVVDGELNTTNNTIAYTVSSQKDLLYAEATADTDENGTPDVGGLVAFSFNHLLSKAYFTFKTDKKFATDAYTYEISAIQFDNAYTNGTYNVGTPAWTGEGDAALSFGDTVTLAPSKDVAVSTTSELVKVFIPQEDVKVSFTVTIKYDNDTTDSVPAKAISVKKYNFTVFPSAESKKSVAGHSYNFVAEFKENAQINFTVHDVTDWVVEDDIDLM